MRRKVRFFSMLAAICLLGVLQPARSDVNLPENVTNPRTALEGWNIIHLAVANLDKLVAEPRLAEVAAQASLCTPALRVLASHTVASEQRPKLAELTQRASLSLSTLVQACTVGNVEQARRQLRQCHAALEELKPLFDAKTSAGGIFFCAMHPEVISESATMPCTKCGMRLYPRRIPHSFVFVPPGETTMLMTVAPEAKLIAGQRAEIRLKLARRDGLPVMLRDLMAMHTQPIHLLIVDTSLQDYHHEHPAPTAFSQVPAGFQPLRGDVCGPAPRGSGEYMFSFTPRMSGSYRVFADVVPVDSGIQEYVRAGLPGTESGGAGVDSAAKHEASVAHMRFKLSLVDQRGAPLRARQTRALQIAVSDEAGQPVTQLEPFMNAFAHLVGFYEDGTTVVHLHPEGGDVLRKDVRGGPYLNFRFHPPKAGFVRLFCQVQRGGRDLMVPFGIVVLE
jgi:hypothetical protein